MNVSLVLIARGKSPLDNGPPPKFDRVDSKFGWSYFSMRRGYWDVGTGVLICAWLLSCYLP